MKKIIVSLLALLALAGAIWLGRTGYRHWKQEHLVRQARYFLSQADQTNAILCLQNALRSNPANVEASRMIADLSDLGHSRSAIYWRRRVVELAPGAMADRLAWAKTALTLGDLTSANEALLHVDETTRQTAEYHKDIGALAWALKDFGAAESNYLAAVTLEPTNVSCRLNLATVKLMSPLPDKANEGRLMLGQLGTNAAMRCPALRELIRDAAHNGAMDKALYYSAELQKDSQSTFPDHLLRLEVLQQAKSPLLADYFSDMKQSSASNSIQAYNLGRWMFQHDRTNEAVGWMRSLPVNIQTNLPLPILLAEGYVSSGKWADLAALTKAQNWRDMDYLRHAFNARALRGLGDSKAAALEWQTALQSSRKRLDALNELTRRTAEWRWESEMDATLWTIMDNFPLDKEAFLVLYNELYTAGNTAGLRKLLTETAAAVPANTELENNLAIVSLLLNSDETKGHDLARDVYTKDPKNPFFLSTYAYSLYLHHKSNEALKLFDTLSPQSLTNAAVATYYGIILNGSGKGAQAKPYLEMARGAKLLPEELSLVKKAKEGI